MSATVSTWRSGSSTHPDVNGLFNLGTRGRLAASKISPAPCSRAFGAVPADLSYVDTPRGHQAQLSILHRGPAWNVLRNAGYTRPFTSLADGVRDYVGRYLSLPDSIPLSTE